MTASSPLLLWVSSPMRARHSSLAGLMAVVLMVIGLFFQEIDPALRINELICGMLVVILCWWWMRRAQVWSRWLIAAIGTWLLVAPLLWWSTHPWLTACDLIVGTMLIVAASILPTMHDSDHGNSTPPGWDYNPSAWSQRLPIALIAFCGFLMSGYLAIYQLGYIDTAWDPLFADGTEKVLTSEVSHWFPISDAGLGAFSYLLEVLTCFVGDRRRWRTMPWMVLLFGLMIVPTGAVSIVLVVLQPIAVGSWCFLCLTTAVLMLVMVSPALDEVIATWQALKRYRQQRGAWWHGLWYGIDEDIAAAVPEPLENKNSPFAWHLLIGAVLSVWLMAAPYVVETANTAAGANDHLAGAVAVSAAVIALSEIARPVRWILLVVGAWLIVGSWWLPGATTWSSLNATVVGMLLIIIGAIRGRLVLRFGTAP